MPGSSWTIASRLRVRRLKSVDLPTLGRPTMTTIGVIECLVFSVQCLMKSRTRPCRSLNTEHSTFNIEIACNLLHRDREHAAVARLHHHRVRVERDRGGA